MLKLEEFLSRRSSPFVVTSGLALIGLLGVIDFLTGSELSFSVFYLIPVSVVAWLAGRQAGIAMSLVGAATWLGADMLLGVRYSHPTIPLWNALVRLAFFLIVTYALSALQASREWEKELSGFIVHDLRAPLGNVMAGLQTLQELAGGAITENELIDICVASCRRMLVLVNSLLDLDRLEHGQMQLQRTNVAVRELIEAALAQVSLWAARGRITFSTHLEEGIDTVYSDPTLTTRILVNLLGNAIKFSTPLSVVGLKAAHCDGDMVAFSVIDQGPGIPEEWQDRLFTRFAQVDTPTARRRQGSGLGLAFCRLAVEAQGGRIWLDSSTDKGTTVTFTLQKGSLVLRAAAAGQHALAVIEDDSSR